MVKKLLAVLGSITLITSSSSAVIACTTSTSSLDLNNQNYFNNNFNNLMGAASQKAKAIILDDQFGIAQSKTLSSLGTMMASETIPDYQPHDGALNQDSTLKDVVGKYFGFNPVGADVAKGKNIVLGHTNGVESSLESFVPDKFKPFAQQALSWIKSANLVSEPFLNFASLNQSLNSINDFFKANGESINKIIDQLLKILKEKLGLDIKEKLQEFLPKISNAVEFLMNLEPVNKLRAILPKIPAIYQQLVEEAFSDLTKADLTFQSINQKLFSLIVELLNQVIDLTPNPDLNPLDPALDNDEKFLITLIDHLISNEPIKWKDLQSSTNLLALTKTSFELIILCNIYFQEFDALKTYHVVDKDHLFSPTKDNYTFLSGLKTKKVSESIVFKDHALNFNYFLANLDYFIGSLRNFDQQAEYRFQQLLFLLFNDPANPSQGTDPYYLDKQSILLNHSFNIGLGVAYLKKLAPSQIELILKDERTKQTLLNLLKPVVLGLINGDDASALVQFINNFLPVLEKLIPELNQFPWNEVMQIVKQVVKNLASNPENTQNLFHFLMMGQGQILLKDVQLPAQVSRLLNLFFGSGEQNLMTLFNKPLHEIFAIFEAFNLPVPGFEHGVINIFGDNFTLKSIPELIGLLTSYLNHLDPSSIWNANQYLVEDQDKQVILQQSLKILNFDPQPFVNLLTSFLGNEAKNNLISQFLNKLFTFNESGALALNVPDALEVLGFLGNSTYQQTAFLGALAQSTLPILNQKIKEDPTIIEQGQIKLDRSEYFQVDLFQLWTHDLLDVFNKLTTPADYATLIDRLLSNTKAYELTYDPSQIYYFNNTRNTLIKSFKYQIIFKNPVNGLQTTYWFEVSRNNNAEVFHFDSIINDKILNETSTQLD